MAAPPAARKRPAPRGQPAEQPGMAASSRRSSPRQRRAGRRAGRPPGRAACRSTMASAVGSSRCASTGRASAARHRAARSRGPRAPPTRGRRGAGAAWPAATRRAAARATPGRGGQADDVLLDLLGHVHPADGGDELAHVGRSRTGSSWSSGETDPCVSSICRSAAGDRVAHRDARHEPVALGLGQRVGALHLDRVLGGDHHERRLAARRWCRRP